MLDIIVQFVERKMSVDDFIVELNNNENLKEILSKKLTFDSFIGDNLYRYLLEQDLKVLRERLNAISALKLFLKYTDVKFEANDEELDLYFLIIKVQPKWIFLPDSYISKLLDMARDKKGKELEVFLRKNIKDNFKYTKKPPRWLQSSHWIFENGEPLLFIGQMDITELKQETSQLYVFYDENIEKYHFVEQFM